MLVATHCNQPFLSVISHFPVPSRADSTSAKKSHAQRLKRCALLVRCFLARNDFTEQLASVEVGELRREKQENETQDETLTRSIPF